MPFTSIPQPITGGSGPGGSDSQQDKTPFSEGTSLFVPTGGVFNDVLSSPLAEDEAGAVRLTSVRAIHVNLRDNAGNQHGTLTTPLRTDPTGTTAQPVSGSLAIVSTVTNLVQLNGQAISMNTGVRDAGTQRVTIATNDIVPVSQSGTPWLSKEVRSSSATNSSPSVTTVSTSILAANVNRLGATIYNEGPDICYVKLGAIASLTSYSLQIVVGGYYEIPFAYTGAIDGITLIGTAQQRVTELS